MIGSGYGGPDRQTDRADSGRRRPGPPSEFLVYLQGRAKPFRCSGRFEVRELLRRRTEAVLRIVAVYCLPKKLADVTTTFNRVCRPDAVELRRIGAEADLVTAAFCEQGSSLKLKGKGGPTVYPRSARKRALDELEGEFS